jgi:3-oxoacyl-[acyl-carrier protein] reductase
MPDNITLFKVGNRYEVSQAMTPALMAAFRDLSGDDNPMHLDDIFACAHGFRGRIAYGNLLGAMLSRLVGVELPTREVLILRQTLEFRQPAYMGEEIRLAAEVTAVHEAVRSIQLKLQFHSAQQDPICTGQCLIKCL